MLQPSGYNQIKPGNTVRTVCPCGEYRTRWRHVTGKPPKLVLMKPFTCPQCGKELSSTQVIR